MNDNAHRSTSVTDALLGDDAVVEVKTCPSAAEYPSLLEALIAGKVSNDPLYNLLVIWSPINNFYFE